MNMNVTESNMVMKANEAFLRFINTFDIYLNDNLFSKEPLLRSYAQFIVQTNQSKEHDVGIALHTGSILFDAITVLYATIGNMILNSIQTDDIVDSLQIGDMVTYNNGRYRYSGVVERASGEKIIILKSEDRYHTELYIYSKYWHLLAPYKGKASKTGKVGAGKGQKNRALFYEQVLGYKKSDVPSLIDTSTVFVMSKDHADKIIKGLTISFGEKVIKLTDLVTASYYTENQIIPYPGNSANNEPVLKFTNRFSVARDVFADKSGNKNIGLFVIGDDVIARGSSELPSLLNRKSLDYVFLSMPIDSDQVFAMLDAVEKKDVFVCNRNFLSKGNFTSPVAENELTQELSDQVNTIVNNQIVTSVVKGPLSWEEYKDFKRIMKIIKNSEYDSEAKDSFVINAYSLMNLFISALFPVRRMDNLLASGETEVLSSSEKIDELIKNIEKFPEYLKEKAEKALDYLLISSEFLYSNSPKQEFLRNLLINHRNDNIALILPKMYYGTIIRSTLNKSLLGNIDISTQKKFDSSRRYDLIIFSGNPRSEDFDIFRCKSAPVIQLIIYECEEKIYRLQRRKSEEKDKKLEAVSKHEEYIPKADYWAENAEVDEDTEITNELNDYVDQLNIKAGYSSIGNISGGTANSTSDCVAYVTFETGERAFLTKMYKAYVMNESTGTVKEVSAENLDEGDALIFTKNNAETHDIVDNMLQMLIDQKNFSDEIIDYYKKSKEWKSSLIKYMHDNNMTPAGVAKKMIDNGISVQELTIRTWLDEDSHTVGPRDISSLKQIAYFTENEHMLDHADDYHKACGEIRKIRMDILDKIGKAIISNYGNGKKSAKWDNPIITRNVESLSMVLRIDSILFFDEKKIPSGFTNRPLVNRQGEMLYE